MSMFIVFLCHATPRQKYRFFIRVFCSDCGEQPGRPCKWWSHKRRVIWKWVGGLPRIHLARKDFAKRDVNYERDAKYMDYVP